MNRLHIQVSLMAGLAMLATTAAPPAAADSVRVPIRSANARAWQGNPNTQPTPTPISPTPLPVAPLPGLPPSVGSPLPPQPVPDHAPDDQLPPPRDPSALPGGGPMYRGPLGADFQRENVPKKEYLGDDGRGPGSQPLPNGPVPFVPAQPGAVIDPGAVSGPIAGTDRYGVAPPPGTLGQTYQRRTRLIDDEKHPRVGIVEVHLSENYEVTAKGLKVKWTGKVWRLESDPLLPG
ncbi:MAG: hypothetical protein H7062_05560, partial [Candidatus Saccharimonas sp.]|nr:hypothetical protein [Planctomycetaceae bacterium]